MAAGRENGEIQMWDNIRRIDDEAENVCKFVYTNGTAVVESVLYKYPTYQERTVICCSTQSGCPVGCRFCGAGDYFVRNLTSDEIVSQAAYSVEQTGAPSEDIQKLQIMFMSMGEPLLNLKALIPALYTLYEKYPQARLLISTSAPSISDDMWAKLIETTIAIPTIGLQFSVHESTDEARNLLVPFKAKMTLAEIATYGSDWFASAGGRKPFFNYCAHDGNSTAEDADRIRALYDPAIFNATVSVVCERNEGLPATNDHQRQLAVDFAALLVERGYDVRVFDPAGQDTIGGGCGQLWFVQQWMEQNPTLARPSIGHGREVVHAPTAA
jgi:23S rRNA (adenine2503-C2)-methyltransferase